MAPPIVCNAFMPGPPAQLRFREKSLCRLTMLMVLSTVHAALPLLSEYLVPLLQRVDDERTHKSNNPEA